MDEPTTRAGRMWVKRAGPEFKADIAAAVRRVEVDAVQDCEDELRGRILIAQNALAIQGSLRTELFDLMNTFNLRWKADMRAIDRWQHAHPGSDLIWPDHADLVVWLMEKSEKMRRQLDVAGRTLDLYLTGDTEFDEELVRATIKQIRMLAEE
jgi:hypothetical protein